MVTAIVLAAGESQRMGRPKALLPFGSGTVLSTVVRSLERCPIDEVIVVAGPHATALAEALREELLLGDPSLGEAGAHARTSAEPRSTSHQAVGRPVPGRPPSVRLVVNDRYRDGMLSSVQRGLAAAAPETTWFVIALVDQPMIEPSIVTRLLETAQTTTARIVLPTFEGRRGHPILFHADLAAEVATLSGAIGLRELLQRHPEAILHVPVSSDTILRDLDTPEEYERERARLHDGPATLKQQR